MQQEQVFNVAVIGAGIGASHIEGFLALPERFKVTTVCDLDRMRATQAASRIPGCKITDAIDDVLTDRDIDIVDICLPPHLHFPIMMDSLSAGKHVVCEKPFTTSLFEADAVIKRATETGRRVFPVFQYRYGLGFQRLLHLVKTGMAGRPHAASLETHWKRGGDYYAVPWRGTWASERGGAIVGHAIHIHNLATRVLGPVSKVGAFLDTRVNEIETEDCGALAFQMQNGALLTSSITLGAANDSSRMRIAFEHVTAQSGAHPYEIGADGWTFTATDPARQAAFDTEIEHLTAVPNGFDGLLLDVHKAMIGAADAEPVTLDEARHSIELITATYQSARESQIVSLPLDASHPLYRGWMPDA